jgi:hypothetical protein
LHDGVNFFQIATGGKSASEWKKSVAHSGAAAEKKPKADAERKKEMLKISFASFFRVFCKKL